MSNGQSPAEQTGQEAAAPTTAPFAALPPRIRVHALAKLLSVTSKQLLVRLAELGETAGSAQSSVSREVALRVAESYGVTGEKQPDAEPEQPAQDATPEAASPLQPASTQPFGAPPAQAAPPAQPAVPPAVVTPTQPPEPEQPSLETPAPAASSPMFMAPEISAAPPAAKPAPKDSPSDDTDKPAGRESDADTDPDDDSDDDGDGDGAQRRRRRRGRRGRGRGKGADGADEQSEETAKDDENAGQKDNKADADQDADDADDSDGGSRRRRRRRRRRSGDSAGGNDDPPNTVVHTRDGGKEAQDQVRSVRGSTRLEAKRQRRRDGREAGRRKAPILSEAEFLARRESVERTMVVRENNTGKERTTQIGVLEDDVLVEHFVTSSGTQSIVGNVYLGRVQNVLPSMEAAFVDIGRGRNAVLYAGEVDWDAAGLEGKSRKIEQALSSGDLVLVQVTKDPVGHKGARLTTQISLPGRFLVYVPGGGATGISRKLPENERRRLKDLMKKIVPADAGVIIRTASEGISEEELERDVRRLQTQWEAISEQSEKVKSSGKGGKGKGKGGGKTGPTLVYEEPDLLVKVVRDLFTEDFVKLVIQGSTAWETIDSYVQSVAPDLADRLDKYVGTGDVFSDYRIDEQITKALDRKVWLPSGGYLVIDRTEAMTVIDVNTGKFTGSGGNLEETVTRNNLESAEEIVRQLRLRDIGGIIVIDFIDMVLESNRDLVLRRLTECLSRDRTRHQVAEVTSLGLVQMTRKRVGTGLIEAFSSTCEHCKGRGVVVSSEPQTRSGPPNGQQQSGGRKRKGGKSDVAVVKEPTPHQRESVASAVAAMASASNVTPPKSGDEAGDAQENAADQGRPVAEESTGESAASAPDKPDASSADGGRASEREVPEPASSPEAAPVGEAKPDEPSDAATSPTDGEDASAAEPESEPSAAETAPEVPMPAVRTVRRRPRRVASRPAGPPVEPATAPAAASDADGGSGGPGVTAPGAAT